VPKINILSGEVLSYSVRNKATLGPRTEAAQGTFGWSKAALRYMTGPSSHHRSLGRGLLPPKSSFLLTDKGTKFGIF